MSEFGFVGTGNMGGALATAVCKAVSPETVCLANKTKAKAEKLAEKLGCKVGENIDAASKDFVFLGVKPNMMEGVIKDLLNGNKPLNGVFISMAAALSMETISGFFGDSTTPLVRIMPNTPVSVGEGVILYAKNEYVSDEQMNEIKDSLRFAGTLVELDEKLIDAGSAVSGCGPAFAYMFIEALADGGVACGLKRSQAVELAAAMVKGSAALVLESGKNPGQLKDEVCSPGGSTIAGVRSLEENAFRGAAMDAIIASYDKTLKMAKK